MELRAETYDVGDIVYFMNPKDEGVIPALITEVIIRRRLNADTMASYVTQVITRTGIRQIELNPSETTLFANLGAVREFMIEKTTKKIDQIIAAAEKASRKLEPENDPLVDAQQQQSNDPGHLVTLPDGSTARFKV